MRKKGFSPFLPFTDWRNPTILVYSCGHARISWTDPTPSLRWLTSGTKRSNLGLALHAPPLNKTRNFPNFHLTTLPPFPTSYLTFLPRPRPSHHTTLPPSQLTNPLPPPPFSLLLSSLLSHLFKLSPSQQQIEHQCFSTR